MKSSARLSLPLILGVVALLGAAWLVVKTSLAGKEGPAPQASASHLPTAPSRAMASAPDATAGNPDEERGAAQPESSLATRSAERRPSVHGQPAVSTTPSLPPAAPETAAASPPSDHARRMALAAGGTFVPAVHSQGGHPFSAADSSTAGGSAGTPSAAAPAAALPLAHQITDDQAQQIAPQVPSEALAHIQDQFAQEVGADHLDPADPEYSQRWEMAKATAADRIRTLYGWAAYAEFQRQAALAAVAPQQ